MTLVVAPLAAVLIQVFFKLFKPPVPVRVVDWGRRLNKVFDRIRTLSPLKQYALGLAVTILWVTAVMTPTVFEHLSRPDDAEASLHWFVPIHDPFADPSRVERTLAEFERARRHLVSQWSIREVGQPISLHLYRSSREYTASTGVSWAGGHARCFDDGVTIGVPLEQASNVFDNSPPSRTPLHEMVHATMCQKSGRRQFYSIPLWFHEGMAEFYEHEGLKQLPRRVAKRLWVWLKRQDLLIPDEFCTYNYVAEGPRTEISLFYRTTLEFVRSLEAGHGMHTFHTLVDRVASGHAFEDSLYDHFGGSCQELYTEWVQSL